MMKINRRVLGALVAGSLAVASLMATSGVARAGLGDLLKGGAVVLLVDKFGDSINDFVNKITLNSGIGAEDRTKVVPIVSVGQGGFIGAAQVSGPAHLVEKVKAVAQLESKFNSFRVKALVPIESKEIVKDMKRVTGVGVSAIIDMKLNL